MASSTDARSGILPTQFLDNLLPRLRGVVGSLFVEAVAAGADSPEAVCEHVEKALAERSAWAGETRKCLLLDDLGSQLVDCDPEGNVLPLLRQFHAEACVYAGWVQFLPVETLRWMRDEGAKIRARYWPSDRPASQVTGDHLRVLGGDPKGFTELHAYRWLAEMREGTA